MNTQMTKIKSFVSKHEFPLTIAAGALMGLGIGVAAIALDPNRTVEELENS